MTAGVGTDDFNGGSSFGAGVLGKDNAKKAPLNILLDNKTIIKNPPKGGVQIRHEFMRE